MSVNVDEIVPPGKASDTPTGRPISVALARWVMVITVSYAIILSSEDLADFWPSHVFVIAILLSNLVLSWSLSHGSSWMRLSLWTTLADIGAVVLAIMIAGRVAGQFFVVFFSVLLFAAVLERLSLVVLLTVAACIAYALLLYADGGAAAFEDPGLLVRMPVLFGVALYFGTAVQEARREYRVWRRDRALQALSEIGDMATGSATDPGPVLYQAARRVQQVMGVDRCSLIVFERSGQRGFLAASGDDPNVELLLLTFEEYPELALTFSDGEIVELHPGNPPDLWEQVQRHLPQSSPFRSFLVVPVKFRDEVLGVLFLRDASPDRSFSRASRDFCAQAAQMIAAFIREHDLVDQLRERSLHDGLTGLLTFQAFRQQAARALREARELSPPFTVVALDIDDLGGINERHGHDTGDDVIREVGQRLVQSLPDSPFVCRYGGDAFIALARGTKDEIQEALRSRFLGGTPWRGPVQPQASIGVAGFRNDGDDLDELIEAARRGVQAARDAGGNTIWPA